MRIGHYEEGVTGRHDAEKILTPFLESLLAERQPPRIAVWLHDADSTNKISQTLLELGVNTEDELGAVERYLIERRGEQPTVS